MLNLTISIDSSYIYKFSIFIDEFKPTIKALSNIQETLHIICALKDVVINESWPSTSTHSSDQSVVSAADSSSNLRPAKRLRHEKDQETGDHVFDTRPKPSRYDSPFPNAQETLTSSSSTSTTTVISKDSAGA